MDVMHQHQHKLPHQQPAATVWLESMLDLLQASSSSSPVNDSPAAEDQLLTHANTHNTPSPSLSFVPSLSWSPYQSSASLDDHIFQLPQHWYNGPTVDVNANSFAFDINNNNNQPIFQQLVVPSDYMPSSFHPAEIFSPTVMLAPTECAFVESPQMHPSPLQPLLKPATATTIAPTTTPTTTSAPESTTRPQKPMPQQLRRLARPRTASPTPSGGAQSPSTPTPPTTPTTPSTPSGAEKPLSCTQCTTRFQRHHDLLRHMRTIHAPKSHHCHLCDSSFARSDSLGKHLARHERSGNGLVLRRVRRDKSDNSEAKASSPIPSVRDE